MAGKVQHEIPQLFQRGFLIPETGDTERVFVFRRDGKVYPSNIDRSGAEGYFYSNPTSDGSATLDDVITDYESRLATLVAQLRALPPGSDANSEIVAEVVAHLTTRNAHLRGAFTHAAKTLASKISTLFGDQEKLYQLMGLDEDEPGEKYHKTIGPILRDDPRFKVLGLPDPVLERVAFFIAREDFSRSFAEYLPQVQMFSNRLSMAAPKLAANGHKKALAQSVVPDAGVARLSVFRWQVAAINHDLILPDCVAIGLHGDGESHPLMMADPDETVAVVMPLSSRSLLIGKRNESYSVRIDVFNEIAAVCSHNYFICASNTPALNALIPLIGQRSVKIIEDALSAGIDEFHSPALNGGRTSNSKSSEFTEIPDTAKITAPSLSQGINVRFVGDFDQHTAHCIGEVLRDVIAEAGRTIPLDRLDGITFSDNYPEALRSLDRGIPDAKPIETIQTEDLSGIAQSPTVLRKSVLRRHVVATGWVARALIGDEPLRAQSIHTIANQLALIGFTQVVDERLPGALLKPFSNQLARDLHSCVYPGWNGYFALRASARFDPNFIVIEEETLITGLRRAQSNIPAARFDYRHHGDLNRLLELVLPCVSFILGHAGNLLGHSDGLDTTPSDNAVLIALLKEMHLNAWIKDYHCQLSDLWDRRGLWESFDEFLALNRHTERLLWRFGIFPWLTSEGDYRIELPLAIDAEALSNFDLGAGSPN